MHGVCAIAIGQGGELVENSTATMNLAQGFSVAGGRMTNVTASLNGQEGLYAIQTTVNGAVAYYNYGCGFSLIRAVFNGGTADTNVHAGGLCATDGSLVTNLLATNNSPFGASIQDHSTIIQSSAALGSAPGVTLSSNSCYKDITLSGNYLTGGQPLTGTNVLCNY